MTNGMGMSIEVNGPFSL